MNIKDAFEAILTILNVVFYKLIRIAAFGHAVIVEIFSILLMLFILPMTGLWMISKLPPVWESRVFTIIMSAMSIMFLSVVALRIWKKEKFFALYEKYAM